MYVYIYVKMKMKSLYLMVGLFHLIQITSFDHAIYDLQLINCNTA